MWLGHEVDSWGCNEEGKGSRVVCLVVKDDKDG